MHTVPSEILCYVTQSGLVWRRILVYTVNPQITESSSRQLLTCQVPLAKIEIKCNTHLMPFLSQPFHFFTFTFLLLLTFSVLISQNEKHFWNFFYQWLRLKVVFINFQSQPFIGIASYRVLHLISIPLAIQIIQVLLQKAVPILGDLPIIFTVQRVFLNFFLLFINYNKIFSYWVSQKL